MPQKFGIIVFGMSDGQVGEESWFQKHAGSLKHQAANRPVYIRFAGNGCSFVGKQGMNKTGTNTQLELQFVPALESNSLKVIFFYRIG